jgi:hypothetical protein
MLCQECQFLQCAPNVLEPDKRYHERYMHGPGLSMSPAFTNASPVVSLEIQIINDETFSHRHSKSISTDPAFASHPLHLDRFRPAFLSSAELHQHLLI